ncbi:MAG: dockerin type I domain-containing protein, partial [Ignavibacteriales bacterium]|nr:dockerin type I domain-containing protein [Ignavibacteriales bacterium]
TLVLGDGAMIIRRGTGAILASTPAFGNSISISYLLDPSNGSLTTRTELPTASTVLKTLRVNNPNHTPNQSGVFLDHSVTVRDTLFLDAGFLSKGSSELTIASGGTIQMGGGSFDTTGTSHGAPIVTTYNLVYRTGTTTTSTDREFVSGGSNVVANLVVLDAQDGTPTTLALHANRAVRNVTLNSDEGGLALGPASSLASHTLTITGNLTVSAGAFLSSTGITSLVDLAGTTPQTVTVPASGLLLPGGLSSINLRLNNPGGFLLQGGDLTVGQDAVLFFVNGLLRTGQNTLVLTQTSGGQGFDRSAVVPPQLSHVLGRVRHQVVGGAGSPTIHPNGRYEFPVGSATKYRPFAITFGGSYPAINSSTIDVEHQDVAPTGTAGFPIDGGSGVRIGNYASFSWVVTVGANSIAPNQRYDLEVQAPDLHSARVQDLRLVQRLETSPSNPWTLQGSGSSYYGNDLIVTSAGDSIARLRCAFTTGTLTAQGTRFAVGVPARQPMFLITLRDTTIAENQRLDFRYLADPLDLGETITYTLINPPTGASIDPSSGSFVWRPSFGQAGSYSIIVTASDGQLLNIASATVTVRRVNRPPAFTRVLRDTTIRETRDTLRFTYTAADPEGDVLIFQLLSGPPGLTVTNSGVLQWVATSQQINKSYLVKVVVTDGLAGDTTSASIFVTRNRVRGDVDGDGLITANDASSVLKHVVGILVLADPAALFAADASRDGTITAYDASLILQAAVGLIVIPTFSVQDVSSVKESVPTLSAQAWTATLDWSTISGGRGSSECRLLLRLVSGKSDVYAVEWQIQGDFVRHPVKNIAPSLPYGWQVLYKQTDRELNIAFIGATPISGRELATVAFSMTPEDDRLALSGNGFINESPQPLSQLDIAAVPSAFALEQNYPNPFNPSTTIRYLISERSHVSLVVYNMQGQHIRTLSDATVEPGSYTLSWDGRNDRGDLVSSGSYVYRLIAGSFISNQRMILIR